MTTKMPVWIPSLLLSGVVAVATVACSSGPVTPKSNPSNPDKKDGGSYGGTGGSWIPPDSGLLPVDGNVVTATCGNGIVDDGESCDDSNTNPDDGCTPICQRQADWKCEKPGQPCVYDVRCGDGVLATVEACDDGNEADNDGCSAKCDQVTPGWQCRVPGRKCVPLCGDGIKTAGEGCDDGNSASGDGCSSTCLIEPGWDCKDEPSVCVKSVCGNGKPEAGEACDNGAKNGLMFGDGSGCSKTCTKEPTCRDKDGHNMACSTACGDGNLDAGEECDDGNQADRDGCNSACKKEQGFSCDPQSVPDTQACSSGTGQCLVMPIVYRDFKSEKEEKGGHPDFFDMSARDASGNAKRWCVSNSGGPAKKGDSTARCWDIAATDLVNGKPVYNSKRADNMCACQFTDWSKDGNGGKVPEYKDAESPLHDSSDWHTGVTFPQDGKPRWTGRMPIVKDAESFGQWFTDNDFNTKVQRTIELAAIQDGRFQFSSAPHAVSGGFFPLDDSTTDEAPLCNLWPYWYWNVAGKTCAGSQYLFPPSVTAEGWSEVTGKKHNFWFTSEVHYLFAYREGMSLQFYGDDDLFIFINGQLVLDLGGVHQRLPGKVTVSGDPGVATIVEGGSIVEATGAISTCADTAAGNPDCRNRTMDLGLVPGLIYEIAIFHADRHPTESNYQLTLSGFSTTRSVCQPRCGDGTVSAGEECDEGDKNNDTLYGGCTTKCKFGPFCGDGNPDPGEDCDLGRKNGQVDGADGCTQACKKPARCGDGNVNPGEQCDMGDQNGKPGKLCTEKCTLNIL